MNAAPAVMRVGREPHARLGVVISARLSFASLCLVMLLAGVGSTVDVVVFGIHDHLIGAEPGLQDPLARAVHDRPDQRSPEAADSHGRHHCDLHMNPAEVSPRVDLVTPMPAGDLPVEASVPVPASLPSVPFTPPRA